MLVPFVFGAPPLNTLLKLISCYFLSIKYSTIAKLSKASNVPKINTPITIIIFVLKIKAPRLL